jgi:hypothetical protein
MSLSPGRGERPGDKVLMSEPTAHPSEVVELPRPAGLGRTGHLIRDWMTQHSFRCEIRACVIVDLTGGAG